MIKTTLLTLMLGMTLLIAGASGPEGGARAAGCLTSNEARAAVQSGQAVSLSQILGRIRSAAGGEIVPPPQLCNQGGQLVYIVNVLSGGQVTKLTVDAKTGNILGH
jgi:Peptidase propeptide and YPEB domain